MTKLNLKTWLSLLLLTVLAGIAASSSLVYALPMILCMAALKFLGVAFSFMEMHRSNVLWKVLIISYVVLFSVIVLTLL